MRFLVLWQSLAVFLFHFSCLVPRGAAFGTRSNQNERQRIISRRFESDRGFGSNNHPDSTAPTQSYEESQQLLLSDDNAATMMEFFDDKRSWLPMFRDLSIQPCLAANLLTTTKDGEASPRHLHTALPDKPSEEKDMALLSAFLDSMQQFLSNMPMTNSRQDDENDIQFIEEGRRLMAIQRFHVTSPSQNLFETCWSEIYELTTTNDPHTGSIILVPHLPLQELDEFCQTQIVRPLEWLGLQTQFEAVSLQRDSPAIRLLYRLQDMPDITNRRDDS